MKNILIKDKEVNTLISEEKATDIFESSIKDNVGEANTISLDFDKNIEGVSLTFLGKLIDLVETEFPDKNYVFTSDNEKLDEAIRHKVDLLERHGR